MRHRCSPGFLFLALALSAVPSVTRAQIVNVLDAVESAEEGMAGAADFTVEWRTGNTNLLRFGWNLGASYRDGRHLLFFQWKLTEATQKDSLEGSYETPYINNSFEHLRYRFHLRGPLSAEAFLQHAMDAKQRLRVRALAGGGVRLETPKAKWGFVAFGTDYMFSYEEYYEDCACAGDPEGCSVCDDGKACDDDETPVETLFYHPYQHRWSSYLQLVLSLADNLSYQHTTFFQPRFDDFGDYRLMTEAGLVLKAGRFYTKTSFTVSYYSRLAVWCPGVENFDTILKNAIGFTF